MEMNPLLKRFVNSPLWAVLLKHWFLPPLFALLPERPARILEVGCGRGDTTRMLLARFPAATIVATDYDPAQVALATRRIVSERLEIRRADAAKLPFPEASFDLVVEFNTFHHVERWMEALVECARVLAPGGTFAVMDEPMAEWNALFRWFDAPDAVFSKKAFLAAADDAGFSPVTSLPGGSIIRAVFRKK